MKLSITLVKCFECGVYTEYEDIEDKIIERGYHHDKKCAFYIPNTCAVCDCIMEDDPDASCTRCDFYSDDE